MKKKIMQLLAFVPIIVVSLVFLNRCEAPPSAIQKKPAPKVQLLEAAAELTAREMDYHAVKRKSDWKKIYGFQTADYKKKIPFEEFVYFGGYKRPDWKEVAEKETLAVLSGFKVHLPPIEEMRAKIEKEKPKYIFAGESGIFAGRVSRFEFKDKVQISTDGKYGRTALFMYVQWMSTVVWIDTINRVDFWDLEDGKWRVQLNRWDFRPISGMRKPPGPDIQYKNVPLNDIIDYRLQRARDLYSAGKKEEAGKEFLRAVELKPFETFPKIPLEDAAIKKVVAKCVLKKVDEWLAYLSHLELMNIEKIQASASWSPEKIQAKKAELEKLKQDFSL